MNILFVASDNDVASGAFLSMVRLCALLKNKYNHNVCVVIPREGNGENLLDAAGIPHKFIRTYNWISRIKDFKSLKNVVGRVFKCCLNKAAFFKYCSFFREFKPDIVHLNTTWTYLAAKAALKMKVPYVWHIREFLEEDQNMRIWNRKYGYRLIEQADRVIAISDSIMLKYKALIPRANFVKIYNGIEIQKFYYPYHRLFCQPAAQLLIVGTLSQSKGQEQLIDACADLLQKGCRDFLLKIVGKGNEEYVEGLKKKVLSYGLESRVEFCGYRTDTECFYREADLTFVCSSAEAFGRVTVEAMLGGSLVIGAKSAATMELISDAETGILYNYGNSSDLADKILWALGHGEDVQKIAQKGQEYMRENMTDENNALRVNDVYDSIVRLRRRVS